MKKIIHSLFLFGLSVGLTLTFSQLLYSSEEIEIKFEENHSVPLVYLNLVIKAGAAHDPIGKEGLGYLTSEALLRGTQDYSKEELNRALDQIGARFENEIRTESVIFRGVALADQFDEFLKIARSILTRPNFTEKELQSLKNETISTLLNLRSKDQKLADLHWQKFFFGTHPYSNPPHGRIESIKKITLNDIKKHFSLLLQTQNLSLIGTGASTQNKLHDFSLLLKKALPSNLSPGAENSALKKFSAPLAPEKLRVRLVNKKDRSQTQVYVGLPGIKMSDPNYFALNLGNQVFGGGTFSARMMVEIRVKRGWSYGANSFFRYGLEPRSWQAYTFPASKDTAEAVAKIKEMITEMAEKGATNDEFSFNQMSLVNGAGFTFNTPKKRVENILIEQTLNLPNGFMRLMAERTSKLTLNEVNTAMGQFLNHSPLSILVLGSKEKILTDLAKSLKIKESDIEVIESDQI